MGLKFQETEILIIQVMSNKKSIVLIDPDVLQRIQQDIDQDLEFKKVSFLCYIVNCRNFVNNSMILIGKIEC